MQGFVTVTTFTTWVRWFRWESLAELAGLQTAHQEDTSDEEEVIHPTVD
jgi:hypothetical protein